MLTLAHVGTISCNTFMRSLIFSLRSCNDIGLTHKA